MPAAAVAAVGAAAAIGGSIYASNQYAKQAKQAQEAAQKAAEQEQKWREEQLSFAKEQYSRWEQDFGEIQTEVADYFKELSDDVLKQQYEDANTSANNSLLQQYFTAQQQLSSQMNKQGMANSGAAVSASLQLQQSMLSQKAQNRWNTEQLKSQALSQVMGQKQSWVSQGESLRQQAVNLESAVYEQAANSAATDKINYTNLAYQAQSNKINAISSGLQSVGGALMGAAGQMYTAKTLADSSKTNNDTTTTTTPTTNNSTSSVNFPLQSYYFNQALNNSSSSNSKNYSNFIDTNTTTNLTKKYV